VESQAGNNGTIRWSGWKEEERGARNKKNRKRARSEETKNNVSWLDPIFGNKEQS